MADEDDVTEQDVLALHEDILEGSEEAVRELLEDFREDGTPTLGLCTAEIQVRMGGGRESRRSAFTSGGTVVGGLHVRKRT